MIDLIAPANVCTQFKHEVYQLWTPDGFVIVLSPDFLPEIRQLPDSICDFYSGVKEVCSQNPRKIHDIN